MIQGWQASRGNSVRRLRPPIRDAIKLKACGLLYTRDLRQVFQDFFVDEGVWVAVELDGGAGMWGVPERADFPSDYFGGILGTHLAQLFRHFS